MLRFIIRVLALTSTGRLTYVFIHFYIDSR